MQLPKLARLIVQNHLAYPCILMMSVNCKLSQPFLTSFICMICSCVEISICDCDNHKLWQSVVAFRTTGFENDFIANFREL